MTAEEIKKLVSTGQFPVHCINPELKETHISWVILCRDFVFKIKKPVSYPFLDFSTREKRKFYCERERVLNNRLTHDIYLGVLNINVNGDEISISKDSGDTIDHALMMRRLDPSRQMDLLVSEGKPGEKEMNQLAEVLSDFHKKAEIITNKDPLDIGPAFNEIRETGNFRKEHFTGKVSGMISKAVEASDRFLDDHATLIRERLVSGFFRDCHGDLHTRNIFLLNEPVIFDCIEFNDEFRHIDILNEIAFLCMDLEANGANDLAGIFRKAYNARFTVIRHSEDEHLFQYYKSYRANVRAKVNFFRARDAQDPKLQQAALDEAIKYLTLMDKYLQTLT